MLKNVKGFTLLEILIVIIILALLATIAVPKYLNTIEKSKAGEAYANLGALRSAGLRYLAEQAGLGTSQRPKATDIETLGVNITGGNWDYAIENWDSTGGASGVYFTLKATRKDGGKAGGYITITDDGTLNDSNWRDK